MGDEGEEIVPAKGDMLDELTGCAISFEPGHGYIFSSHKGDEFISNESDALAAFENYCATQPNSYATLVKRNPQNGHEFILSVVKLAEPPRPPPAGLLMAYSWALAIVGVGLAGYLALKGGGVGGGRLMRHRRRRLHFVA